MNIAGGFKGCVLLVLAVCALPGYGWQLPKAAGKSVAPPTPPAAAAAANGSGPSNSASEAIFLDVAVTDSAGHPVGGLPAQDFTLLEDGHPEPIASFRDVSGPGKSRQQVVFLLDSVNLTFLEISQARTALSKLLRQNGGKLAAPTSILILTDTGITRSGDPTEDGNVLAAGLDKADTTLRDIGRSAGFYGATDRLDISYRALDLVASLEGKQPGRKLLVWISEGWPYLASPDVTYTSKQEHQLFQSVVGFSNLLRQSRVVLYDVDPRGTNHADSFQTYYYEGFIKGLRKESDALTANLGLQVLAIQSGGLVQNSSNDIVAELARCLDDVGVDYEMTTAQLPAEAKTPYHTLEVKVNQPGLKVRTRTGYYSQP